MTRRSRRAAKVLSAARAGAIVLLLVMALPTLEAHIQGARPIYQRDESERSVGLDPGALGVEATFSLARDPLRQTVQHEVDPSRGVYYVEHRTDASRRDDLFFSQWRFERLIEYRDQNVDGFYQPVTDTAVKAWRFTHYQWSRAAIQRAQVADVTGIDIVWEANLTSAPHQRVEVVLAGKNFIDEGAFVRAQDVVMYWDFTKMPARGLGSLYALEATITVPRDTTLALYEVENASTALIAQGALRRGLLVWGGEAVLDGREQRIDATIEDERIGDDGNKTARLVLHLPTVDASMRFVMVSGVEYVTEDKRAPMPALMPLLALLVVALALRK